MARKPIPGKDEGTWGDILNEYLDVAHAADGTLKNDSVAESKLAPGVRAKLNAGGSGGGVPDDGSVTTAKLADDAVTNAKVAPNANIAQSKVAGLTTALDGKANTSHTHTIANVTGLQTALDGKAASNHTHPTPDIELGDLTDVNADGATAGQVLTWQGSQWAAADQTGGTGGGGVTDHGALNGLADDDHPQYLNNTRGDARYYTKAQVDSALDDKADSTHTHGAAAINSGVLSPARLGTGTASASTVLFGDGTWKTAPSGGGGGVPDDGSVTTAKLADNAVTNAKVAANANIAQSKVAGLTADLAAKADSDATVNLSGNQTVAGVKTFSSSPVVPNPTSNGQAANKAYVDSVAGGGGGGGAPSLNVVTVTADHDAVAGQWVIGNAAEGGFNVQLPTPTAGAWIKVKKLDNTVNSVLVWPPTGQQVNAGSMTSNTISVNVYGLSYDFWADGTQWHLA